MKKGVIKIIFVIMIVVLIIVGKNIIDKKTFKYEETLENSLSSYMVSGNTSDLDPIVELLDKDFGIEDTYIIGNAIISRPKFIRNFSSTKKDSSSIIPSLIQSSILEASQYYSLCDELNNRVLHKIR